MKINLIGLGILLLVFLVIVSFVLKNEGDGYQTILDGLKSAKLNTIEVIKAMPAEKYNYKPTSDVRTFAEQAAHIAYATEGFTDMFLQKNPEWKLGDGTKLSKLELIELNKKNFDRIIEVIGSTQYQDGLYSGVISFLDHNAHHRGQMIVYLRMNGIKPPEYR